MSSATWAIDKSKAKVSSKEKDQKNSAQTEDDRELLETESLRTNSTKDHSSIKSTSSVNKDKPNEANINQGTEEGKKEKDNKTLEQHLVVAKMNWANAELKVDLLREEVKQLRKTIKVLELDLVKTKQNLGETMNAVYEYEQK